MSERIVALLLKAVQQLPADEREEVRDALIGGAMARMVSATVRGSDVAAPAAAGPDQVTVTGLGPLGRTVAQQPLGTRDALGTGALPGEGDAALKVLPVRLPATDYERLRAFSREHGFSMAVIIRTLVERFLDGQARRWASRRDEPDDADGELDDQTPTGHA
jgi:hypothetical protein